MIITKSKTRKEIMALLDGINRIFIVGCGTCAEQCHTGGEKDVKKMRTWLTGQGKKITGSVVPDETCHIPLVKKDLRRCGKELAGAEAVLIMACGAGTAAVREAVTLKVISANNTIALGDTLRKGKFSGRCSLCGDCILDRTAGFCPVTLCPKGLLNGPCGGMDKGKCEVDPDNDCVWAKIYDAQAERDNLRIMKVINDPRDYCKTKRDEKVEVDR